MCVVALLQIPFIRKRERNTKYFGDTITLLVAVQMALAIVAASLPDVRALALRVWPGLRSRRGDRGEVGLGDRGEERKRKRRQDWLRDTVPRSVMGTTGTLRVCEREDENALVVVVVPGEAHVNEVETVRYSSWDG